MILSSLLSLCVNCFIQLFIPELPPLCISIFSMYSCDMKTMISPKSLMIKSNEDEVFLVLAVIMNIA